MYKDTVKKPARTIEIPETIDYPDIRIHLESLDKNDKIIVQVIVKDKNGVEKLNETEKITLVAYPKDSKVIGRLAFNLTETN